MRFQFTVFLLVLNLIVFGFIAYLNHSARENDPSSGSLSEKIARRLIEADRLELVRGEDATTFILERRGLTWDMVKPTQWKANDYAISRIINQLQFLEEEASFTVGEIRKTGQTPADYGLEPPAFTLVIGNGDESIALSVGAVTGIGNNYYLLGPDKREIFVIKNKGIDGLWVDLEELRSRQVFGIPAFEVDEIDLQVRSDALDDISYLKVRLAKNQDIWAFEAPLSDNANSALVENMIHTLTSIKVGRFVENAQINPLLQGLEVPFMEVTIHGNKRRQTLLVGNLDPRSKNGTEYFAKLDNNSAVFTVPSRPFKRLQEAQEALRERNFMRFDPEQLSTIDISANERKIHLQKLEAGNDWQVIENTAEAPIRPYHADTSIIESLITNLGNLKATHFAVDAPSSADNERFGFNNPIGRLTLNFAEEAPLILTLAHPKGSHDRLYAKTNRADFIYRVNYKSTLRMIPTSAADYRNRTLDTLPQAAKIRSIRLTRRLNGNPILEVTSDENAPDWESRLEKMDSMTASHVRQLLSSIRSFKVEHYLPEHYKEEGYRLDKDTTLLPWTLELVADIELPGGDSTRPDSRSYVFTERLSGSVQFGASIQNDTVFRLPQPLIDTLYELSNDMESIPESEDLKTEPPRDIVPVPKPAPIP